MMFGWPLLVYVSSVLYMMSCFRIDGTLCASSKQSEECKQSKACLRDHTFSNDHATSNKVVLSYAHNGFGNQLWEHAFAWHVAEAIGAQFYILPIAPSLWRGGGMPPNTLPGYEATKVIFPSRFFFPLDVRNVMEDSSRLDEHRMITDAYKLCDNETMAFTDIDVGSGDARHKYLRTIFSEHGLQSFVKDSNPRCFKFMGYFQEPPSLNCLNNFRKLLLPKLNKFYRPNKTINTLLPVKGPSSSPHNSLRTSNSPAAAAKTIKNSTIVEQSIKENDICIYLRCKSSHYFWNSVEYYQTILPRLVSNSTGSRSTVWLFKAPECMTQRHKHAPVLDYLERHHHTKRYL